MPSYGVEVYILSAFMLISMAMLPVGIALMIKEHKIRKYGFYDTKRWRYTRSAKPNA